MHPVDKELAVKVLEVVDQGLTSGMGIPEPGKMCVEAAVCYALGIDHDDEPPCVNEDVRSFKIDLNDRNWSSEKARAQGLRRIAVAQLGSNKIAQNKFYGELEFHVIKDVFPKIATKIYPKFNSTRINKAKTFKETRKLMHELDDYLCNQQVDKDSTLPRNAVGDIRDLIQQCTDEAIPEGGLLKEYYSETERDEIYTLIAEAGIAALRKLKSPGVKWLNLC